MTTIHLTKWLFVVTVLLSGCATTSSPPLSPPIKEPSPAPENTEPDFIPAVRYGRYPLVEQAPDAAKRDLMLQVIDEALPESGLIDHRAKTALLPVSVHPLLILQPGCGIIGRRDSSDGE